MREQRGRLQAAAAERAAYGSRRSTTEAPTEVARYASLLLSGHLRRGVPPPRAGRGVGTPEPGRRGQVDSLPPMAADGGTRAVVAALLANTGIAITKFIAFFLTGVSSMLAEAIHSVADAGNQGAAAARRQAQSRARRPRSTRSATAASATSTASSWPSCCSRVGGLFALYEAYHKYHEIHEAHGHRRTHPRSRWWWVPLVVLGIAIVLESLSFRTAIIETNKVRGDASFAQFIRRAKQPELPVILLEDLAALLGLVFALFAVGAAR